MRKKNRYMWVLLLPLFLSPACDLIENYRRGDVVATVHGKSLYMSDLQEITANALSAEDSAALADSYIRQWTIETALYDKARRDADQPKQIEDKVEDYRRMLYVREYEEKLVREKMPKYIPEDTIRSFYNNHPTYFTLRENLVKGLLIIVPLHAPEQDNLKTWLGNLTDENMELIEKYAYQNASGYELFTEQWQPQSKILLCMPMERNNMNTLLRERGLITMNDSTSCYLLRVTDKRMKGESTPYEYAREDIEKLLLEYRQKEFLKQERDNIYNSIKH